MSSLLESIAGQMLAGFDDYRRRFRAITDEAPQRFRQALWHEAQDAAVARIELYEVCVQRTCGHLQQAVAAAQPVPVEQWPAVKQVYRERLVTRQDGELAETWFNSLFCRLYSHDSISDDTLFIHSSWTPGATPAVPPLRRYACAGDLPAALARLLADYQEPLPLADPAGDQARLLHQLQQVLPEWVCRDPALELELFSAVFYRNKGAYLVGRIRSAADQWPLVLSLIHPEGQGIRLDAAITDEAQVSIIFSFTRSYFMVDVAEPATLVAWLRTLLPAKQVAELYTAIGFYKHGKSEFYRALIGHLADSDERFVMAPGVRGMVMSVFTLEGFNTVFKVIKDRFSPAKLVDRATVIEKYRLVKNIDRVGRMADTQEFADFRFPRSRFAPECLEELLQVAPTTVRLEGDSVLIRHCWTERRMTPLNLYLESASAAQCEEALDDYGLAIKQLAAANIFPGDMLLKNFGVTRHGRVVFYDYDEISLLTEVNFRHIPPPRYPEDELAAEPWYSVGPQDVFPEEFPRFLFADRQQRQRFARLHGELYDADYWCGLQQAIRAGKVIDVYPYRRPPD